MDTNKNPQHTWTDRPLLSVREAADNIGLSRSTLYQLIKSGDVNSVTVGSRRLVPAAELERFVASLIESQTR
jgi:excisionase family DNA binding protein